MKYVSFIFQNGFFNYIKRLSIANIFTLNVYLQFLNTEQNNILIKNMVHLNNYYYQQIKNYILLNILKCNGEMEGHYFIVFIFINIHLQWPQS